MILKAVPRLIKKKFNTNETVGKTRNGDGKQKRKKQGKNKKDRQIEKRTKNIKKTTGVFTKSNISTRGRQIDPNLLKGHFCFQKKVSLKTKFIDKKIFMWQEANNT